MARSKLALLAVAAGTFMVTFDGAAVELALPVLRREFDRPLTDVQWVMTGFLLASTAVLLPAGRAGDVFGRARVWRAGVVLFVAASAAAAFMPNLWWLVGVRVVQGIATGLVTAQAAAVLSAAFPESRAFALGVGNVAIALGLVAGPPVGALLTRAISWRLIFPPAALVGAGAWLLSLGRLHDEHGPRRPLDAAGAVLSALALGALVSGGVYARRWGWGSSATVALFAAGGVLVVAFALRERQAPAPLLATALLRRRLFLSGAVTALLGFFALFCLTIAMPFFLVEAQKRSLVGAGLLVGMVPLGVIIAGPLAGLLTDRVGSRWPCTVALIIVAGAPLLVVAAGSNVSTGLLALALGLVGIGFGGFEAPNLSSALAAAGEEDLGVGTATLNVLQNLGMTMGTAVAATLVSMGMERTSGSPAERAAAGVRLALIAGAVAAGVGAIAAAVRPRGR